MSILQQSYWDGNGTYQSLADKLELIKPTQGKVKGTKNKQLERYRIAVNAYYDLYNNGLWNRIRSFNRIFNIAANNYKYGAGQYSSNLYKIIEPKMDEIIFAAAKEQGLI